MKIKKWLQEIFNAEEFNDIHLSIIAEALSDGSVRSAWLMQVLDDIRQINLDADKCLLVGDTYRLSDLCSRRRAYTDILSAVLAAKRKVTQEVRPNPRPMVAVDLDRVTT